MSGIQSLDSSKKSSQSSQQSEKLVFAVPVPRTARLGEEFVFTQNLVGQDSDQTNELDHYAVVPYDSQSSEDLNNNNNNERAVTPPPRVLTPEENFKKFASFFEEFEKEEE